MFRSTVLVVARIVLCSLALARLASAADKEKVLLNLDSETPDPHGLFSDPAGNLYGVSFSGGGLHYGAVFELSRRGDGTWKETILYSFCGNWCGSGPGGTLALDSAGNIYGATALGGAYDYGVAFQLVRHPDGSWHENVLHSFGGKGDGAHAGSLVMDAQGNLYGTTLTGGATCPPYPGCGIIYELKPRGNGKWTYKVLHKFEGKDGNQPGGLIMDAAGNLYSGTLYGGRWPCSPGQGFGCGVVFELSPEANGKWDFKLLHSFDGRDGEMVWSYLSIDSLGRLYGTTAEGGDLKGCDAPYGCGVVFQLAPEANGKWREKVLHASHLPKHNNLEALAVDGSGNVYVTSAQGGTDDDGAVFELTATTHGDWNVTSLHSFNDKDGNDPNDLFFGSDGNLYGTTGAGGAYDSGTLFELTP